LLCGPSWPGTNDLPALASQALGLQVSNTMPAPQSIFNDDFQIKSEYVLKESNIFSKILGGI
jgi:hypothetical protein